MRSCLSGECCCIAATDDVEDNRSGGAFGGATAGKFTIVTVDDRIPCKPGTTKPAFTQPNGNELWAMMLEKAFAKFVGSYAALESGQVAWAWEAITGEHASTLAASHLLGWSLATS
jgi:hypothetical protein